MIFMQPVFRLIARSKTCHFAKTCQHNPPLEENDENILKSFFFDGMHHDFNVASHIVFHYSLIQNSNAVIRIFKWYPKDEISSFLSIFCSSLSSFFPHFISYQEMIFLRFWSLFQIYHILIDKGGDKDLLRHGETSGREGCWLVRSEFWPGLILHLVAWDNSFA